MRFIYLDASGLGKRDLEPNVIVAGVIVHADKQYRALAKYLSDMADEYVRPDRRGGVACCAAELFSGGKNFPRDEYEKEARWKILDVRWPAQGRTPRVNSRSKSSGTNDAEVSVFGT